MFQFLVLGFLFGMSTGFVISGAIIMSLNTHKKDLTYHPID